MLPIHNIVDTLFVWHWAYVTLGEIVAYGVLAYTSLMLSHIAAFNILYELRMKISQKLLRLLLGFLLKGLPVN